jgi:hypothetical protein
MIRSIWSMPSVSGDIGCPVSFANSNCRASSAVPTRTRRTSRARTGRAVDRGSAVIPLPGAAAATDGVGAVVDGTAPAVPPLGPEQPASATVSRATMNGHRAARIHASSIE